MGKDGEKNEEFCFLMVRSLFFGVGIGQASSFYVL